MAETLRTYGPRWYQKMTEIWNDRISYYRIHRTGALRRSLQGTHLTTTDLTLTAEFRFLAYGIYVDSGRGPNSTSGQVDRRPWLRPRWRVSCHVLARQAALAAGTLYTEAFTTLR